MLPASNNHQLKLEELLTAYAKHFWFHIKRLRNTPILYSFLLYLLVSTRAVIGQFSGPYSPVRPAKM